MPFNILQNTLGGKNVHLPPGVDVQDQIKKLIGSSDIFLFMKGTPESPQCGFSANVVQILNQLKVSFNSFDILSNAELRQAIKDFSNWPTYPQLFFKGALIGGNDIVTEMLQSGDLQKLLLP